MADGEINKEEEKVSRNLWLCCRRLSLDLSLSLSFALSLSLSLGIRVTKKKKKETASERPRSAMVERMMKSSDAFALRHRLGIEHYRLEFGDTTPCRMTGVTLHMTGVTLHCVNSLRSSYTGLYPSPHKGARRLRGL